MFHTVMFYVMFNSLEAELFEVSLPNVRRFVPVPLCYR